MCATEILLPSRYSVLISIISRHGSQRGFERIKHSKKMNPLSFNIYVYVQYFSIFANLNYPPPRFHISRYAPDYKPYCFLFSCVYVRTYRRHHDRVKSSSVPFCLRTGGSVFIIIFMFSHKNRDELSIRFIRD